MKLKRVPKIERKHRNMIMRDILVNRIGNWHRQDKFRFRYNSIYSWIRYAMSERSSEYRYSKVNEHKVTRHKDKVVWEPRLEHILRKVGYPK